MTEAMGEVFTACQEVRLLHPSSTAKLGSGRGWRSSLDRLSYTLSNPCGVIHFFEDDNDPHNIEVAVYPISLFKARVMDEDRVLAAVLDESGFLDSPTNSIRFEKFRIDSESETIQFNLERAYNVKEGARLLLTKFVFVD